MRIVEYIYTKYQLFLKQNQTQLFVTIIFLLPTIILIASTLITLLFFQERSRTLIQGFADNLYQDQIINSKILNKLIVLQINGQVQKVSWQIHLTNQFYQKYLLDQIQRNNKFKAAVLNAQRAFDNQENPEIIKMFQKNVLTTSSWLQPNFGYLEQLDEISLQQVENSSRQDFLLKTIMYDQKFKDGRWLQIYNMYFGFAHDGMLFSFAYSINMREYVIPKDCPYYSLPYRFDVRCRFYFKPTVNSPSIVIFPPSLNIVGNGLNYFATNFCQRILKYTNQDPNSENSVFSLTCTTLNLDQISTYFVNFSSNSLYQMLLDPRSLSLVYYSKEQIQSVIQFQTLETQYLQDQKQAQIFLNNLQQNSNYVVEKTERIDLSNPFKNDQKTFEYNRNGTQCLVILNTLTMIDKVPKYETLKSVNPSSKYEIKNIYLFLDVLSKNKMQIYANNLENTILYYNKVFFYVSLSIVVLMLLIITIYSVQLGFCILYPAVHLKEILNQIKIVNQKQDPKSVSLLTDQSELNNQILIDDQIDADFDGYCLSKETQDLLNSFQNVFQILRFTTQGYFLFNQSTSLLNLNSYIDHFRQFGNSRALGVCYNNMGAIHLNCGRYQEALENFEKSIIYSKYELQIYSCQELIEQNLNKKLQKFKNEFKNFLFNSEEQNIDTSKIQLFVENYKIKFKIEECNSDIEQLFQNLFNRNLNYQASLIVYLKQQNYYLWDAFEDVVIENIAISQLYLSPSNKREILNYYNLLTGDLNYYQRDQTNQILNILMQYYINIYFESNLNDKINDSQSNQKTLSKPKDKYYLENLINKGFVQIKKNSQNNQDQIILNSPLNVFKDLDKFANNFQSQGDQNEKILVSSFINDISSLSLAKSKKDKLRSRSSHFSQSKLAKQIQNNQIQKQKLNQNQPNNKNPKDKFKTFQVFNYSNQFLLKDSQNIINQKQQSLLNKCKNMMNESNFEDFQKQESSNFPLVSPINNKSRKNTNNQMQKNQNLNLKNQKISFYQVRKDFKQGKKNIFDCNSDIFFSCCTLQQAQYQITQHNYYIAASILVKSLEDCKYYLPILKKRQISLLQQILEKNNITNIQLKQVCDKYDYLTDANLNIYLVSTCYNNSFKKKISFISYDLINQILFKENDSFGILDYNFEEKIFTQCIGATQVKIIKSNLQIFSDIFMQFFYNHQKNQQKMKQNTKTDQINQNENKEFLTAQTKLFFDDNKPFKYFQTIKSDLSDTKKSNIQQTYLNDKQKSKDDSNIVFIEKRNSKEFLAQQGLSCIQSFNLTEQSIVSLIDRENFNEVDNVLIQKYYKNNQQSDLNRNKNLSWNFFEQPLNYSLNFIKSSDVTLQTQNQLKQQINESKTFQTISEKNSQKTNKKQKTAEEFMMRQDSIKKDKTNKIESDLYKSNIKSELLFIQGILACLKQFVFNHSEKLSTFMAEYKFRYEKQQQFQVKKMSYTYIIYTTDQKLSLQNDLLIQKLQILVLILSESQSLEEHKILQDIFFNRRQVISFFFSEEKMLQYIYNSREHIKNYYSTVIIEHF